MFCTHWPVISDSNLNFLFHPKKHSYDDECLFLVTMITECAKHVTLNYAIEEIAGKELDWKCFRDTIHKVFRCIDPFYFSMNRAANALITLYEAQRNNNVQLQIRMAKSLFFAIAFSSNALRN